MPTPRFFADECVYTETIEFVRGLGFEVLRAQDLGLREAPDPIILAKAQELNCVLLTNDHGFGDLRLYPPPDHEGIVVLKLADYHSTPKVHAVLRNLAVAS
jgi:predicted nuclease of predicted toxin-antitoxin system